MNCFWQWYPYSRVFLTSTDIAKMFIFILGKDFVIIHFSCHLRTSKSFSVSLIDLCCCFVFFLPSLMMTSFARRGRKGEPPPHQPQCWMETGTPQDWKALQCVIKTAQFITAIAFPSQQDIYNTVVIRRVHDIIADSTHPHYGFFHTFGKCCRRLNQEQRGSRTAFAHRPPDIWIIQKKKKKRERN